MEKFIRFNNLFASGYFIFAFFLRYWSHLIQPNEMGSKISTAWILGTLALLLLRMLKGVFSNQKTWSWESLFMIKTASRPILGVLLVFFALLFGTAYTAKAATVLCSNFSGIVDGNDPSTYSTINFKPFPHGKEIRHHRLCIMVFSRSPGRPQVLLR